MKKNLFILAISCFSILLTSCGGSESGSETAKEKEVVEATQAADFIASYSANQAEYDAKYLDKTITVSGPVAYAEALDGGCKVDIKGADDVQIISCNFEEGSLKESELPEEGASVTITGKCTGYIEEEMMGSKTINMVQCLIE